MRIVKGGGHPLMGRGLPLLGMVIGSPERLLQSQLLRFGRTSGDIITLPLSTVCKEEFGMSGFHFGYQPITFFWRYCRMVSLTGLVR